MNRLEYEPVQQTVVHVAGPRPPIGSDVRQTCARCGAVLHPMVGHGGFPEGADIEQGRGYVAMLLAATPNDMRCPLRDAEESVPPERG